MPQPTLSFAIFVELIVEQNLSELTRKMGRGLAPLLLFITRLTGNVTSMFLELM
jgi:hypothetical protein